MNSGSPFTRSGWNRLDEWLRRPGTAYGRWLGKIPSRVAWLGLLVAIICPPHGTGIPLCWFKTWTGLPCPGCGLTRSLSCGVRGMFAESWHYHPFGLVILGFFLGAALVSICPPAWQTRLARRMEPHALSINAVYLTLVLAFLAFGLTRLLLQLTGIAQFGI